MLVPDHSFDSLIICVSDDFESFDPMQEAMLKAVMLLLLVVILAFGSYFLAAMATFLLLEQKDEHTLNTIAVTPIGASGYLKFKMAYVYLMSVAGNIVILLGTKLIAGDKYTVLGMSLFDNIDLSHIISFSVVNALLTRHSACCRAPLLRTR